MKNIKKKYLTVIMSVAMAFGIFVLPSSIVLAAPAATGPAECTVSSGLSIPPACPDYKCDNKSPQECLKQNPITMWAVFFINLLGVIVVIGASAMLVFAGIEYITAADNPERVKKAKQKIINVIMGIVAFFFLYAFLQWLIPGGAF
jgi:hypothetical protein